MKRTSILVVALALWLALAASAQTVGNTDASTNPAAATTQTRDLKPFVVTASSSTTKGSGNSRAFDVIDDITNDDTPFITGGLDDDGFSYSSSLLEPQSYTDTFRMIGPTQNNSKGHKTKHPFKLTANNSDGDLSKRIIYYYQTLTDLSPIWNHLNPKTGKPYTTDINLASFHLGRMSDGTLIHLNDAPPNDPSFSNVWPQLAQLQAMGVRLNMMLGGAGGAYKTLFSDFSTFYPVIEQTLRQYNFQGIDLDVEEPVSLSDIEMLIHQLRSDFGNHFIITLAPVATDMTGEGGLSGFDYSQLYNDIGNEINWFNIQFYSEYGSLASTYDYANAVSHNFPANMLVAGMLGNANDGSGYVNVHTVAGTVRQLASQYPDFGGVDCWEYFDAQPGNTLNPEQWSSVMSDAMNLK